MEKNEVVTLKQFAFYDIYHYAINQLENDGAGRLIKRICSYALSQNYVTKSSNDMEDPYWEMILPTLEYSIEMEKSDKTPYNLNRKMKHFSFLTAYAKMILSMKVDEKVGIFIKAMCEYMFNSIEPTDLPND